MKPNRTPLQTRLEAIKSLCEKSTPGPWGYCYTGSGDYEVTHESPQEYPIANIWRSYKESHAKHKAPDDADPKFIAASRSLVPALVAALEVALVGLSRYNSEAMRIGSTITPACADKALARISEIMKESE